jgi:SAM-dependent methyltransferase
MFETVNDFYSYNPHLKGEIKLHLGCGTKYRKEWCNIDAYPTQDNETHRGASKVTPDLWADILNLPAHNNSVDIVYSSHVVEHFYRHQAIKLFQEIRRVLKPGGYVITEMPDLTRILFLLKVLPFPPKYPTGMNANRDIVKAQLYGAAWEAIDEGYQCHKYVWQRKEFCKMLEDLRFKIILATGATTSHIPFRDMAVVSMKPIDPKIDIKTTSTLETVLSFYGGRVSRAKKQLKSFYNLAKPSLFLKNN